MVGWFVAWLGLVDLVMWKCVEHSMESDRSDRSEADWLYLVDLEWFNRLPWEFSSISERERWSTPNPCSQTGTGTGTLPLQSTTTTYISPTRRHRSRCFVDNRVRRVLVLALMVAAVVHHEFQSTRSLTHNHKTMGLSRRRRRVESVDLTQISQVIAIRLVHSGNSPVPNNEKRREKNQNQISRSFFQWWKFKFKFLDLFGFRFHTPEPFPTPKREGPWNSWNFSLLVEGGVSRIFSNDSSGRTMRMEWSSFQIFLLVHAETCAQKFPKRKKREN